MRLNRYLAQCGLCSRRQADKYLLQGCVSLNDRVVTGVGAQVQAEDTVTFKGKKLSLRAYRYVLLNKPKDCITTRKDPQGRRTVFSFLGDISEGLFPVGRLDRQSTGLLLLTNDGDMAQKLSHPSSKLQKTYMVQLEDPLSMTDLELLKENKGIMLEDGPIYLDAIEYDLQKPTSVQIVLHSGRNRVLRRLFATLGYKVRKLDRVAYGKLRKTCLPCGKWRPLEAEEVDALRSY